MKRITSSLFLAAFTFGLAAFGAPNDSWFNRPQVIRAADKLAQETELFDEAMHAGGAPAHFIDKVHHFEETVMEFAQMVRFAPYQEAYQEMNHIRADVAMLRTEFNAHPHLLNNPNIYREWSHVRTAYRYLDHEMYHWRGGVHLNSSLSNDVKEMDTFHNR